MTQTNQTSNQHGDERAAIDPLAGLPGNARIEVDAEKIGESAKALRVQLADGRTFWVPKSVASMGTARKVPLARFMRPAAAGMRIDHNDYKPVLIIAVWFWRKVNQKRE
jgi:hypothetical protein